MDIDLGKLTESGDTVDLGDGRLLRIKVQSDPDADPFGEYDTYGKVAPARPIDQRPADFDGNAEKLWNGQDQVWWQPPVGASHRGTAEFDQLRSLVRELLEYGMHGVTLELCEGTDFYGQPIVTNAASLWGIDSLDHEGYLAVVVAQLAEELLASPKES
jgi:hypothetical protein